MPSIHMLVRVRTCGTRIKTKNRIDWVIDPAATQKPMAVLGVLASGRHQKTPINRLRKLQAYACPSGQTSASSEFNRLKSDPISPGARILKITACSAGSFVSFWVSLCAISVV
jgi:hypothetical protein